MKLFKRFAAALLVGVMALAMLTACGGGAASAAKTDAEKLEDMYQKVFNAAMGTELNNDSTLKAAAKAYLTENMKEDGTVSADEDMAIVTKADNDGYVVLVSIMTDDGYTDDEVKAMVENPSEVDKMVAEIKSQPGYEKYAETMKTVVKGMGTGAVKKGDVTNVAAALKLPESIANAMINGGTEE